jgi:hypothetical protein
LRRAAAESLRRRFGKKLASALPKSRQKTATGVPAEFINDGADVIGIGRFRPSGMLLRYLSAGR